MPKTTAVPYCTVKAFRACLAVLGCAAPATVDRDSLVERGISPHAVYPVLGALRYLGLIDGSGQITPDIAPFLDPSDMAGRRMVFERSYARVLADVRFPVENREDLDRLLIERHRVAEGVAAFCATFMLWLAAESGMVVAEARVARRGRPPAHLSQLSPVARAALHAQTRPDAVDEAFMRPGADSGDDRPALDAADASLPRVQPVNTLRTT